jgi:hypothetical protein
MPGGGLLEDQARHVGAVEEQLPGRLSIVERGFLG